MSPKEVTLELIEEALYMAQSRLDAASRQGKLYGESTPVAEYREALQGRVRRYERAIAWVASQIDFEPEPKQEQQAAAKGKGAGGE